MGKEKEATELSNEIGEPLSAPPGFVSLTSFMLERDSSQIDDVSEICLSDKPWILFDRESHDESEEFEESDSEQSEKVRARSCPDDARDEVMKDAPVYYPTKEEFMDAAKYIAKIKPSAEPYGICRIVPPPSWHPPCVIKEKKIWENSRFVARVQWIDGLQDPHSDSEEDHVNSKKTRIAPKELGSGSQCGREFTIETFKKYADEFKSRHFGERERTKPNGSLTVSHGEWDPSIENIEGEYERIVDIPSDEIEILCYDESESRVLGSGFPTTSSNSHLEVVKCSWNLNNVPNLPRSLLSSECLRISPSLGPRIRLGMLFSSHHWRVEEHHLYALSYLHMGAQKVWYAVPSTDRPMLQAALKNWFTDEPEEQHRLVSYLLPSALIRKDIPVFRCVQSRGEFVIVFPGAFHSGFDSGFNISETANFAPLDWLPHGLSAVESYRNVCRRTLLSFDEILLHSAFLAVKEQWEVIFYRKDAAGDRFCMDAYGKEGVLANVLKSRVKSEETARKYFSNPSKIQKMTEDFGVATKRECKICLQDLHFSAAACPCSPNMYSCLYHTMQLCDTSTTCTWNDKFFLFRHDIADLNLLVEAVQGNLSSIYKYAKEKLKLSLSLAPDLAPISPSFSSSKPQLSQGSKSNIRAEAKERVLQSGLNKRKFPDIVSKPTKASNGREALVEKIVARVTVASEQEEYRPYSNFEGEFPTDSSSDDDSDRSK